MPPPLPPANRGSNAGTLIAMMMLAVCAMGLFMLVSMVTPFVMGVILVPVVLGPLVVLQYLVWGRWLDRLRAEDEAREAAKK